MAVKREDVMEFLTDERVEPHLYLAGQLALLALVTAGLFLLEPALGLGR